MPSSAGPIGPAIFPARALRPWFPAEFNDSEGLKGRHFHPTHRIRRFRIPAASRVVETRSEVSLLCEGLFDGRCPRTAARVLPPAGALIVTFAVSGLIHEYVFGIASGKSQSGQMAFFLVQGFATAATNHLRPTGSQRRIARGLTIAFQLVTSLLFFQGVNSVVPFYVHRGR